MKDEEKTKEQSLNKLVEMQQATSELGESKSRGEGIDEFSRILLATSPIGVYITQEGKFRLVSPKFQKIAGRGEDELLGMDSLMLVHPEDRKVARENAIKMLKGKDSHPYEFRIISKSGETRFIMEKILYLSFLIGNYYLEKKKICLKSQIL